MTGEPRSWIRTAAHCALTAAAITVGLSACASEPRPLRFTSAEDAALSVDGAPAPTSSTSGAPTTTRPTLPLAYPTTTTSTTTSTSTSTTTSTTTVPSRPPGSTPTLVPDAGWQAAMLAKVNDLRADAGVGPLSACRTLDAAAQAFSAVLAAAGELGDTGPDGSVLADRVRVAGYTGWSLLGENIASGMRTVDAVVGSWMGSPEHRANLLKAEYTHIGLGRTDSAFGVLTIPYWVQVFGADGRC